MFIKLILVLVWCLVSITDAEFELGYYWQDYSGGPITKNALKLDTNSSIYVGQVYTKQYELLPAFIRTSSPIATSYAYKVKFTSDDNAKVLCSQFVDHFKWVTSNASSYLAIPNLVQGGVELGGRAYYGRVYLNGKPILGKLGGVLAYTVNGEMQYNHGPFEVLTYNKPSYSYCGVYCN